MLLNGRRVLLTGASRGIGEALAGPSPIAALSSALVARVGPARRVANETGGTAYPCDLSDLAALPGSSTASRRRPIDCS